MFRYGNIVNDFTVLNLLYMYMCCVYLCANVILFSKIDSKVLISNGTKCIIN